MQEHHTLKNCAQEELRLFLRKSEVTARQTDKQLHQRFSVQGKLDFPSYSSVFRDPLIKPLSQNERKVPRDINNASQTNLYNQGSNLQTSQTVHSFKSIFVITEALRL